MAEANKLVAQIFTPFQDYINAEQEVREEIRKIMKDIDRPLLELTTSLQVIHCEADCERVHEACLKGRKLFEDVQRGFASLDEVVPEGQYYRYNDHWRFTTQRLCSLAALIVFLEKGILVDKVTVGQIIGIEGRNNLHLDLEDYLMGLLNMASELSRLAVNSVTYGDYDRPLQISRFVAQLNAGFRLLNLKNDSLRKRFDALKYDVKKIEEVVYDLSIRGLVSTSPNQPQTSTTASENIEQQ